MTAFMSPEVVYARAARLPMWVVFMRPTPAYDWDTDEGRELMRAHLQWQLELEDAGVLLAAGPIDPGQPSTGEHPMGMYVFAAPDRPAADRLAEQEPFARAGWRTYTVHAWLLNEGTARAVAAQMVGV